MVTVFGFILSGLSAMVLWRQIRGFIRDWQAAEIARGPAVPEQVIRLPVSGELGLYVEGPRFYTWQKRLRCSLRHVATGLEVPIRPVISGAGVRSLKYSRVQRGRMELPAAGDYALRIEGLAAGDESAYAIVFMHPFTGRLLRFILSCVLLGFGVIGGLVLAILSAVL